VQNKTLVNVVQACGLERTKITTHNR